jgi:hypothetical protein
MSIAVRSSRSASAHPARRRQQAAEVLAADARDRQLAGAGHVGVDRGEPLLGAPGVDRDLARVEERAVDLAGRPDVGDDAARQAATASSMSRIPSSGAPSSTRALPM